MPCVVGLDAPRWREREGFCAQWSWPQGRPAGISATQPARSCEAERIANPDAIPTRPRRPWVKLAPLSVARTHPLNFQATVWLQPVLVVFFWVFFLFFNLANILPILSVLTPRVPCNRHDWGGRGFHT